MEKLVHIAVIEMVVTQRVQCLLLLPLRGARSGV